MTPLLQKLQKEPPATEESEAGEEPED